MKVVKWLDENLEKVVLVALLAALSIIMLVAVISRYVFRSGITWADEMCRLTFLGSVYLGTSWSVKKRAMFRLTSLVDMLPPVPRYVVELFTDAFVFAFLGYVSYYFISAANGFAAKNAVTDVLRFPRYTLYLILGIALFLATARMLQKTVEDIRSGPSMFRADKSRLEREAAEALEAEKDNNPKKEDN